MVVLYYLIFTIVVILLTILIFGICYALYSKRINRVLKNKYKHGNYGSLDKKFFIIVTSSIIILVLLFLIVRHVNDRNYNYSVPFYENIEDFDIEKFENNVKEKIKPTDGFIAINDSFSIMTDKDGKIINAGISLVVKKGDTYYYLSGEYNDDKNSIVYKGGSATASEWLALSYDSLSDYKATFNRIDFKTIWNYINIKETNYFNLRFNFALKNITYHREIHGSVSTIEKDGSISELGSDFNGKIGTFAVSQYRKYLDGSASEVGLKSYLLKP